MWRTEKTNIGQDLVYDGVEFGIATSPTKGTAMIQNANISTESGEALASYNRVAQQQVAITGGTLTPDGTTNFTGPATLKAGTWIKVTASTVSSITATTNPTTVPIEYVAVAGGGGGGTAGSNGTNIGNCGGGGSAGQVEEGTDSLAVGTFAITVGAGGAGAGSAAVTGSTGEATVIDGVTTVVGGGGGGSASLTDITAINGAAGAYGGGGGKRGDPNADGTGGTGTVANTGGNGGGNTDCGGGGGGGASASGGNGSSSLGGTGGTGGAGVVVSIPGYTATLGGGGGAGGSGTRGAGGVGGGGQGGEENLASEAGTANTGGGGGGGGNDGSGSSAGSAGGSGIVVISYPSRSARCSGGDEVYVSGENTVHIFRTSGTFEVEEILPDGFYYVSSASGTTFKLSSKFDPTGANALTHGTTGSITFDVVATPNSMVAKATEKYTTTTNVEYRYYMLDLNGRVWVFDTLINRTYGTQWMLTDPFDYSSFKFTGIGILNGWCLTVGISAIYGRPTVNLGSLALLLNNAYLNEPFPNHRNFAMVGKQGKMYYCDGNYLGEVFPTTSLITSIANIQSYCAYTADGILGTVSSIISGSLPYDPGGVRIPVVFFTDVYGTKPDNINENEVYYIEYDIQAGNFEVFTSLTGGLAIDIETGAAGNQYFNTFYPIGSEAGIGGTVPTVQFSPQRLNLPSNETAQCMAEVGNTVIIGGKTSTLYPWNQIDATPSDFIELPEADVKTIINVNNMAYVFAGNKGNIYITNGSVASLALKVPDYAAGVPGTPLTYIEPNFTWGDADYMRGRVYFSILDQTATKAGNCGGVWSFVPTQNIDPSQEIGMALRLENQQSYGSYNGVATIILAAENQNATSPQYWAAWQNSHSVATSSFGIDFTGTVPVSSYVIETDLISVGTYFDKTTFKQLEYKLTTALASGDSIQVFYRTNSTNAWTSCGTVVEEQAERISGYFNQLFQKSQYLQFRIVVTTSGTTASSFGRFKQLMLR